MANDSTTNIIQYNSRTFGEIRTDLIAFIRQAYPEILSDFTDSSVGSMLIDVNAGVGNIHSSGIYPLRILSEGTEPYDNSAATPQLGITTIYPYTILCLS